MSFVCDAMLGRTARFLRLLGFDTLYSNAFSDQELLRIANDENRNLLTRDSELYQRAVKMNITAYYLGENNYIDRITNLIIKANLNLRLDPAHSRCATCNAKITPISKEEVKDKVPPKTFSRFEEYWICTNSDCAKIYYQGPHWVNITKNYEQIRKNLKDIKGRRK